MSHLISNSSNISSDQLESQENIQVAPTARVLV